MNTIQVDDEILLRPPKISDAEDLFALVDSSRDYLRRWLPWVDGIRSARDYRPWIEGRAGGNEYRLLIVYKGAVVGATGISDLDSPNKAGEIGYWLAENMQGRGIVTRTCRALLNYAVGELGMNRMQIRIATGNKESLAIPERLGFQFEGALRQAELVNGEYYDLALYSMLASEWREAKAL